MTPIEWTEADELATRADGSARRRRRRRQPFVIEHAFDFGGIEKLLPLTFDCCVNSLLRRESRGVQPGV